MTSLWRRITLVTLSAVLQTTLLLVAFYHGSVWHVLFPPREPSLRNPPDCFLDIVCSCKRIHLVSFASVSGKTIRGTKVILVNSEADFTGFFHLFARKVALKTLHGTLVNFGSRLPPKDNRHHPVQRAKHERNLKTNRRSSLISQHYTINLTQNNVYLVY